MLANFGWGQGQTAIKAAKTKHAAAPLSPVKLRITFVNHDEQVISYSTERFARDAAAMFVQLPWVSKVKLLRRSRS